MLLFFHSQSRFREAEEDKHSVLVSTEPVAASWHHFTTSRPEVWLLSSRTWKMRCLNRLWPCLTSWCRGSPLGPWCLAGWCPTSPSTETSAGPRMRRGSPAMCAWSSWLQTSYGSSSGSNSFPVCPLCCTATNLHSKFCPFNTHLLSGQCIYHVEQDSGCFKNQWDILWNSASNGSSQELILHCSCKFVSHLSLPPAEVVDIRRTIYTSYHLHKFTE